MRKNPANQMRYDDRQLTYSIKYTLCIPYAQMDPPPKKRKRKIISTTKLFCSVYSFFLSSFICFFFWMVSFSIVFTIILSISMNLLHHKLFESSSARAQQSYPHKFHGKYQNTNKINGWLFSISSIDKRKSNFPH